MSRDTGAPAPNACRWCGVDRQEHMQLYVEGVGWHGWAEPTDAQRKARMLARRA